MEDAAKMERLLVKKAAAGDIAAFGALAERFQKPVFGFLYGILHSVEDAEDAAQETFLRAWRALERFDVNRRFNTWLFAIAKNVAFNMIKKKGRRNVSLDQTRRDSNAPLIDPPAGKGPDAFETLRKKSLEEAVLNAAAKLPEKAAAIFHLRHREHMKIKEIARSMKISESDVKVTLFRARAFLKKELREWLT